MGKEDRILLTTIPKSPEGNWDNFRRDTRRKLFTYSFPRINSIGLRFLSQNIPEIDILEYPSIGTYKRYLNKGYKTVGYSFYLNETNMILKMIKTARSTSEDLELWGGNYGALTPDVQKYFDEVFIGYAEEAIARKLGIEIDTLKHPPIVWYVQTSFGLKINPVGILFTTRGCPVRCDFCQTPSFCSKIQKVPLRSIEKVIEHYRGMGIREVIIYDENFSLFPKHTKKVVELLHEKGIYWYCMTTSKHLSKDWREWYEMGMLGAFVGIESFSQQVLNSMNKTKADVSETVELIKEVRDHLYLLGFFIIGYEHDDRSSVVRDISRLSDLKLDHTQIRILTPLPQTPLWDEIDSKYGIFETDWSRFDTLNLVWNHPNFTPEEMRKLLLRSLMKCHPRRYVLRTPSKLARRYSREKGLIGSGIYLLKNMLIANSLDYESLR